MKSAISLLLVVFFSIPVASAILSRDNDEDSGIVGFGGQFYDACAAVETLPNATTIQREKAIFCFGFVEGLTAGVTAAELGRTAKTFCSPVEVTNTQLVRVIRKYIADHPEKAHQPTAILAVESLHQAFPCKY